MLHIEKNTLMGQGLIPGPSPFCLSPKIAITYTASPTLEYMDVTFNTGLLKIGVDMFASDTMSGNKDLFEDLILKDFKRI